MPDSREHPQQHPGGCECGELRYIATGEPLAVAVCHCTQCQRQSGSAFGMTMVMPRSQFRLTRGEPRTYTTASDSGTRKVCVFCGTCGIRIYNALGDRPTTVNLKPGTLDDTSWFAPNLQVWRTSQQPWVTLPDVSPTFERNPSAR